MQNKFGVAAQGEDVIIMRMTPGQRLNREDLGNLLAHLVMLGDVTNEELTTAVNELEDHMQASNAGKPAPKAPPAPPPPPTRPGTRRAREAASLQSEPNGDGNE